MSETGGTTPYTAGGPMVVDPGDRGTNLRELLDTLWTGKWIILSFLAIGVAIGYIAILRSAPSYQARGTIQVEREENGLSAAANKISDLVGARPPDASAEISIIKSRMVLGPISEALNFNTYSTPLYLTPIGEAIARSRSSLSKPADPPFELRSLRKYSWGGERLDVGSIEVPASWTGQTFILEATTSGYKLLRGGKVLLTGQAGERARIDTPEGAVSIFVKDLIARPGTEFMVRRIGEQASYDNINGRLRISEESKESGILVIQAIGETPAFAAKIVNDVQEAYLRQNLERRSSQAEQSLSFLKQQLPEIKATVDDAQAKLNAYQLKVGTIDIQKETAAVLERAVALESERLSLLRERDTARQRVTESHPVVAALNDQIRSVAREIEMVRKQSVSLPETQQEILGLVRDVEVNVELYTALLNSAQQLQVAKAGTVGNVRIIDRALPPLSPIKPNKRNMMLAAIVAGLLAGVGAVFGLRLFLRGVDRPEDVERVLGQPTYASVPHSGAQQKLAKRLKSKSSGQILAASDGSDIAIEALRSLRTSLHFAMLDARNNVVAFTGPTAGVGKSFITVNLAGVLAQAGKRVLVVDGDMRRGTLNRYVNLPQHPGLSDILAGTADFMSNIKETSIKGLHLMACGVRPPNPSELLANERFSSLLENLSKLYDYVLIDTPPVMPVTDAAIIGARAGTTLLVLKSGEHPMRVIIETVKRLVNSGSNVRGIVFNEVGKHIGTYGYGAYGQTYGYRTAHHR